MNHSRNELFPYLLVSTRGAQAFFRNTIPFVLRVHCVITDGDWLNLIP